MGCCFVCGDRNGCSGGDRSHPPLHYWSFVKGYVWASDPSARFELKCDLLKSIKQRFDQESISLAYPQRVIYLRDNTQDKKPA